MTLKRVRCSFVVLTNSLDKAPDHIIGFNMVLDKQMIFWPNDKNPYTPKFFSSGMTLKRVRCSFVVLTYSLDKAPDHIIGLNMVLDAIFMGRQDSQKLQGLYGNWITQLYFKIDFAQLMNRIFTSKFEGCSWTRSCSVDF